MKNCFRVVTILSFLAVHPVIFAQGLAVNSSGTAPDTSAILDVSSTNKGLLTPRMTQAERLAISTPAQGLIVYQTDGINGFYYNRGSATSPDWAILTAGGSAAGGDLSGSYPNPSVSAIQGRAVSSSAPSSGDVLKWDGSNWSPGSVTASVLAGMQVFDASGSGSTLNFTVTDLNVRYIFFHGNGRSFSSVNIYLTLPSASSYPSGTIISYQVTAYISSMPSAIYLISPNSYYNGLNANNVSTATATNAWGSQGGRLMTDGISKWYRLYN